MREIVSLTVTDLSSFTKALRRELAEQAERPGHLALMNIIARAAGYQNLQHLRSTSVNTPPAPPVPSFDMAQVLAVQRFFDAAGRLARWPAKTGLQRLAVRALWAKLPARQSMSERQFSAVLDQLHGFGDAALLRRTMVELGLVTRSADCRDYQRVEAAPTPEARALIDWLGGLRVAQGLVTVDQRGDLNALG